MSSLVKNRSKFHLTPPQLASCLEQIVTCLRGRVTVAYIFGSASTGAISDGSDIDLILIHDNTTLPFIERGWEFQDLFAIYPNLDILVYTTEELKQQLAESDTGFWKSVRLSMRQIL